MIHDEVPAIPLLLSVIYLFSDKHNAQWFRHQCDWSMET